MSTRSLFSRLRRFRDETDGNVTIEFVLAMPILFWAFMASFVFYDGYRQSTVNLKAAYTIGDLISRETEEINDNYIDSMHNLLTMMVDSASSGDVDLRISVVRWDEADDRYYVDWSANRGFSEELADANVMELETRLPVMPDNERVILIETNNLFRPLFRVGLDDIDLENFVFTRPRFVSQVVWEVNDVDDGTGES